MKRILSVVLILSCVLSLGTTFAFAAPPCNDTESLADALNELGLFSGTSIDKNGNPVYSLDIAPTRQQAMVMLIRLMGKEDDALNGTYSHPFTDVNSWADRYVAYAYEKGLTSGTGETTFGGNQTINAKQYITFLLRALGYDDSKGDFSYNNVLSFSDSIGLTDGKYTQGNGFFRKDLVWLSCGALLQKTKQGTFLIKQLKKDGVFTDKQYSKSLSIMAVADLAEDFRYVTLSSDSDDVVIDVYNLYSEPGYGEFAGYQRLRGYAFDNKYPIYFSGTKDSYQYRVDANENWNELCSWTYNGRTYKNTRADCYKFFSDTTYFQTYYGSLSSSTLSTSWFRSTFGETYMDWIRYSAFESGNAEKLVERYLEMKSGVYYHEPHGGLYPESYFGLFNAQDAWTEQTLEADWISEWELQELSGENNLSFGKMIINRSGEIDFIYGFFLSGYSSKKLLYVYDMPESFAQANDAEGKYSGINFKKKGGKWYFNPQDLISIGLLNEDGSFNEQFKAEN